MNHQKLNLQHLGFGVLLLAMLTTLACTTSPMDGSTVDSVEAPVVVSGYHAQPNAELPIEAWSFENEEWASIGSATTSSIPITGLNLGPLGDSAYSYFETLNIPGELWKSGFTGKTARLRIHHKRAQYLQDAQCVRENSSGPVDLFIKCSGPLDYVRLCTSDYQRTDRRRSVCHPRLLEVQRVNHGDPEKVQVAPDASSGSYAQTLDENEKLSSAISSISWRGGPLTELELLGYMKMFYSDYWDPNLDDSHWGPKYSDHTMTTLSIPSTETDLSNLNVEAITIADLPGLKLTAQQFPISNYNTVPWIAGARLIDRGRCSARFSNREFALAIRDQFYLELGNALASARRDDLQVSHQFDLVAPRIFLQPSKTDIGLPGFAFYAATQFKVDRPFGSTTVRVTFRLGISFEVDVVGQLNATVEKLDFRITGGDQFLDPFVAEEIRKILGSKINAETRNKFEAVLNETLSSEQNSLGILVRRVHSRQGEIELVLAETETDSQFGPINTVWQISPVIGSDSSPISVTLDCKRTPSETITAVNHTLSKLPESTIPYWFPKMNSERTLGGNAYIYFYPIELPDPLDPLWTPPYEAPDRSLVVKVDRILNGWNRVGTVSYAGAWIGAEFEVCDRQENPEGWITVGQDDDQSRCAYVGTKTIRRVE